MVYNELKVQKTMKLPLIILSSILILPTPVVAQNATVYGECYRNVEEYLPGYYTSDGTFVRGRVKTRRESVFCGNQGYGGSPQYQQQAQAPTTRCGARNTSFGALLGGGIAYFATPRRNYSSSIPVGAVLGAVAANQNCY
jgi:hypothetical protein